MVVQTFGFVGNTDMPSFVRVELRVERGFLFRLSGVNISAAKSLQARVRSALISCGYRWPGKGITVNIAPASEVRSTTQLDLSIALAILAAEGKIPKQSIQNTAFSGELSLDGTIRIADKNIPPLNSIPQSEREQIKFLFSPHKSKINHLSKLITLLNVSIDKPKKLNSSFHSVLLPIDHSRISTDTHKSKTSNFISSNFFDLKGETNAKRKALIAAAGNHHTILIGPPGSGKTVLAKCIHSLHPNQSPAGTRPPWRAPHSSTKAAGLIGSWQQKGGGRGTIVHGEWSLADQGVLFMDEWPEFSRDALEACRVPMETGRVALARASGSTELKAVAQLIAALNPCPCGKRSTKNGKCFCSPREALRYFGKVSGPVADRFGIHIELGEGANRHENNKKLTIFDEFYEILPGFDSKMKYFTSKTSKSDQKGDNLKKVIFDDLDVIQKMLKNEYFLLFLGHFLNKSMHFYDFSSFFRSFNTMKIEFVENEGFLAFFEQNDRYFDDFSAKMIDFMQNLNYQDFELLGEFEKNIKKLKKISDFLAKSSDRKKKAIVLSKFIHLIAHFVILFEFWKECLSRVKKVRRIKEKNGRGYLLEMTQKANNLLNTFITISELSQRGREQIIEVASSAALLDKCEQVEERHIVEASECRLFDRNSWVSAINDTSIPEYNRAEGLKFDSWIQKMDVL